MMRQQVKPERLREQRQLMEELEADRDYAAEVAALAGSPASPMQLTHLHYSIMFEQQLSQENFPMNPYAFEQDADRQERQRLHRVMDIAAARKRRAFRRSMRMLTACLGAGLGFWLLIMGAAWDLPVVRMVGGAVAVASVIAGFASLSKKGGLR